MWFNMSSRYGHIASRAGFMRIKYPPVLGTSGPQTSGSNLYIERMGPSEGRSVTWFYTAHDDRRHVCFIISLSNRFFKPASGFIRDSLFVESDSHTASSTKAKVDTHFDGVVVFKRLVTEVFVFWKKVGMN